MSTEYLDICFSSSGDGTPGLFWDNTAWRGLAEEQEGRPPLYDEPKDTQHPAYYIRRLQPNAKIIAIARNPVSRSYFIDISLSLTQLNPIQCFKKCLRMCRSHLGFEKMTRSADGKISYSAISPKENLFYDQHT